MSRCLIPSKDIDSGGEFEIFGPDRGRGNDMPGPLRALAAVTNDNVANGWGKLEADRTAKATSGKRLLRHGDGFQFMGYYYD
jgi:hypothetical protein